MAELQQMLRAAATQALFNHLSKNVHILSNGGSSSVHFHITPLFP